MIDVSLRAHCPIALTAHEPRDVRTQLQTLAESPYADLPADAYGNGGAAAELENRLVELTGHAAAKFISKGMIAQMAALRTWAEKSGRMSAAIHRLSHFDYDEMGAVEQLHPIKFLRCGDHSGPFTVADLEALGELPGVVSVELPLRRSGYKLTPWDELVAISEWCRTHQVPLHFDGARAWGAAVGYGKPLSELTALADSIYLSFYKELGGLSGCILAGDDSFIAATAPWVARHGGQLYRQFPATVSALDGLDRHLPKLPEYAARARTIAEAINRIEGAYTIPDVPHTAGFQICLELNAEQAEPALEALTRETRIWLAPGFYKMARENHCCFDVETGSAAARLEPAAWATHIERLIEMTKAGSHPKAAE